MATCIELLGPEDELRPTDWIRPLVPECGDEYVNSKNTYSGRPQNHLKWARVAQVIGECWHGKTLAELDVAFSRFNGFNYEVVRGALPVSHCLHLP